jgi:hypothetical protein
MKLNCFIGGRSQNKVVATGYNALKQSTNNAPLITAKKSMSSNSNNVSTGSNSSNIQLVIKPKDLPTAAAPVADSNWKEDVEEKNKAAQPRYLKRKFGSGVLVVNDKPSPWAMDDDEF